MGSNTSAVRVAREALLELAVPVDDLTAAGCGEEYAQLELLARAVAARQHLLLARFDALDGHEAHACASPATWLCQEFRLDPPEAHGRVAAARALRDLPASAGALAAGEIGAGHVRVLTRARRRVGVDVLVEAEPALLALARTEPPAQVQVAVDRLADAVDADDTRDKKALEAQEGRYLHLTPVGSDGEVRLQGQLDAVGATVVQAMLDAHSGKQPLPDGTPDPRTKGQRRADALVAAATTVLQLDREGGRVAGGLPVGVTLVLDVDTLRGTVDAWAPASPLAGVFRRGFGQAALDRLACCPDVTPAVVSRWGVPLALGRTTRFATRDQIRALLLRDGGCVRPGCTNRNLQAHHIDGWARDDGQTDVPEMALVCAREHTLLHEHGWALEHDPDRPGLLRWRPPDGGPPIPAAHAIDRNHGHSAPLW